VTAVRTDVAIVGGGPAGLATAIATASRGLATVLFERAAGPPDKACGEGLMPAGVRWLETSGARALLDPTDVAPIAGIRYVQEDGTQAGGRLPGPGGLGIRRTALTAALAARAAALGAELHWGCAALGCRRRPDAVLLETAEGEVASRVLVAADGLASPLRRAAGLEGRRRKRRRFGLRQHFQLTPWSDFVEVHLRPGIEAFVTPAGASRVGLAFLWEAAAIPGEASVDAFLQLFPALAERLAGAPADSRPRGAGPLARGSRARTADRLALVGDAAGYVDAITGEGVSLAFAGAAALGEVLPEALERGAGRAALAGYERAFAREFRRYAWLTHWTLAVARHPWWRRRAVAFLASHPHTFERLLVWGLG
jgi:flavin-dependent dehydrogenase